MCSIDERFKECPYCGHKILIKEGDILRCCECQMIVAVLNEGFWFSVFPLFEKEISK